MKLSVLLTLSVLLLSCENIQLLDIQNSLNQNNNTVDCGSDPVNPSGSGSSSDPYILCTKDHLDSAKSLIGSGVYFKMGADIDLDPALYPGNEFQPFASFTGFFDGNNFKLQNFTITSDSSGDLGFFKLTNDANISNIELQNVTLTSTGSRVAAIVGQTDGATTIQGCTITGTITAAERAAGIIGYIDDASTIEDCNLNVTINATNSSGRSGALTAQVNHASGTTYMRRISVNAQVNAGRSGGLMAYATNLELDQIYASGTIDRGSKNWPVGGFFSWIASSNVNISVKNSANLMNVISGSAGRAGGFIGQNDSTGVVTIEDSFYAGTVTCTDSARSAITGFGGDQTIINVFYNTDVNPGVGIDNGTTTNLATNSSGQTDALMKTASTFSTWDSSIWSFPAGNYPSLF